MVKKSFGWGGELPTTNNEPITKYAGVTQLVESPACGGMVAGY